MTAKVIDIRKARPGRQLQKLTPDKKAAYIHSGGRRCPYCKSESIEAGDYDFDGNTVLSKVTCCNCPGRWIDVYILTDVTEG